MSWGNCVQNGVATFNCLPIVFNNVVSSALIFAGVALLFFSLYSGIKFIISRGDPKKIENAREALVYTIIGVVIIFSAFFVLNLISYITGVTCIKFFGFNIANCQ